MTTDDPLATLLRRAGGMPPPPGDPGDVRRRARALRRRRRAGVAAGVAAIALPALAGVVAVGRSDDGDGAPGVVAADPTVTPTSPGLDPAGPPAPAGEVLFERELPVGGTLRATSTGVVGEVELVWPGDGRPVVMQPYRWQGMPDPEPLNSYVVVDVAPTMLAQTVTMGGQEPVFTVTTLAACPGSAAAALRTTDVDSGESDTMELVDGVAVTITHAADQHPVEIAPRIEVLDADGEVILGTDPTDPPSAGELERQTQALEPLEATGLTCEGRP